ncbi:hypothetical protein PPTG_23924 [Phytophthora nicotianae INRA-310]|uniref:Uncharacterized protein n=1 Tax=Phytophthora nicotianae (strain INRA-310) TaxID=761204 RepID=W2PPA0_PHYN3|nr:hypothetical protein PPTG_23924 [Phytophthora nicotianae INRA-310]ETN02456.1 hypothetical protein PPTG_23924 [Phytophthora nicotianae INRA-310]
MTKKEADRIATLISFGTSIDVIFHHSGMSSDDRQRPAKKSIMVLPTVY